MQDRLSEFKRKTGLNDSEIAKSIGYSPAVLSSLKAGTYAGDSKMVLEKLDKFISNYTSRDQKSREFIVTENVQMVNFVIRKAIKNRSIAVIYGDAGSGKSETCKRLARGIGNGIYIECDAYLTTRGLFKRVTTALKIAGARSLSETLELIVAELKNRDAVLFIDEAEYLQHKTLEMIRRVWDFSETPIIFIGIHKIVDNLRSHRQLFSRIQYKWEIGKITPADVQEIFSYYGLKRVDEKILKHIIRLTRGNFRSISFLIDNATELSGDITIELIDSAKEMLLLS
jgi:DNA transposition AAA+ family ATPase